jgi:hypothetical protein
MHNRKTPAVRNATIGLSPQKYTGIAVGIRKQKRVESST